MWGILQMTSGNFVSTLSSVKFQICLICSILVQYKMLGVWCKQRLLAVVQKFQTTIGMLASGLTNTYIIGLQK